MRHEEFSRLYDEGLKLTGTPDDQRRPARFYNLIQLKGLTDRLEGMTLEAGCWRGLSSFLLCSSRKQKVKHIIVDGFRGLPKPTVEDGLPIRIRGRFGNTSKSHVLEVLQDFDFVEIYEGMIPGVLREVPNGPYRFIHIDVDLYIPTLSMLRWGWERLVPGGVIVSDDFDRFPDGGDFPGCTRAVTEFSEEVEVHFAALDTGNAFFVKDR